MISLSLECTLWLEYVNALFPIWFLYIFSLDLHAHATHKYIISFDDLAGIFSLSLISLNKTEIFVPETRTQTHTHTPYVERKWERIRFYVQHQPICFYCLFIAYYVIASITTDQKIYSLFMCHLTGDAVYTDNVHASTILAHTNVHLWACAAV